MKKFVVVLIFLLSFLFCSCTANTSGYSAELTQNKWSAKLKNGTDVNLYFENDTACLRIKSEKEVAEIKGKYAVDDKTFVIFVPNIKQNYSFGYVPYGKNLELSYKGSKIKLQSKN